MALLGNLMKTELDIHSYTEWYLENLQYKDDLLTLTIEESERMSGPLISPKRFLVVFSDTLLFQKYDEIDHFTFHSENREDGIIGKYSSSSLIDYLKEKSVLFVNSPSDLEHYSIITSNECFHVITRVAPKVINVT